MRLSIKIVNWSLDLLIFRKFNQLLEDLSLKLEARKMSTICQNQKNLLDDGSKKFNIKLSANINVWTNMIIHIPQALQSNLHQFWLLMLNSEDNWLQNAFKAAGIQVKKALSAVFNDILNELEEAFSEFRVLNEVIHNHLECWLTQMDQDGLQKAK